MFSGEKSGLAVFALPNVTMVHHQGQSSAQMSDFSLAHLVKTRLRYYRKNHGLASGAVTSLVYALRAASGSSNRNRHKQKSSSAPVALVAQPASGLSAR